MLDFIVMQMSRVNCEKGYWLRVTSNNIRKRGASPKTLRFDPQSSEFVNGKRSDLLATCKFDVRGKSFEKIVHVSPPDQVLSDYQTDSFVNSITFNGELFNFNGMALQFDLERN